MLRVADWAEVVPQVVLGGEGGHDRQERHQMLALHHARRRRRRRSVTHSLYHRFAKSMFYVVHSLGRTPLVETGDRTFDFAYRARALAHVGNVQQLHFDERIKRSLLPLPLWRRRCRTAEAEDPNGLRSVQLL